MLKIDDQHWVQLDAIRRYAFLTVERIKERDAGDGYRRVWLRSCGLHKCPVEPHSPVEHRPYKRDVVQKLTARRTFRVGRFNDHGYARISRIGYDKMIILVRLFLYDFQYTFDLKGR
jgi:hypothetical protein